MNAIDQYERLLKQRPSPAFWEANIIDAHKACENERDHKLFYLYLLTPRDQFNPKQVDTIRTLGDAMKEKDFDPNIQDLPDELTADVYKNGNETIIHTRHKCTPPIIGRNEDEDDEKRPLSLTN